MRQHGTRPAEQGIYKIGTLASMVGLNPNILRAWERRYDTFRRNRSSGSQRLYSQEDVLLFQRVKEMLQLGLSISEVASLGREGLLQRPAPPPPPSLTPASLEPVPHDLRSTLMELAPPLSWPGQANRYRGEGLDVPLGSLAPADLATVHRLYQLVKGLYELWTYMEQRPVAELVQRRLQQLCDPLFLACLTQLGAHTGPGAPLVQDALQDASQGALPLLIASACQPQTPDNVSLAISLARDHAKMLRNAFSDLDPALREADECPKAHPLGPVLGKLTHLRDSGWVERVGSEAQGFITSRCLETSALDRILYRCLQPTPAATRGGCQLWVVELESGLLRWALHYPAGSPAPEFAENALPTRIVSMAMGVSPRQALAQGYLGVRPDPTGHWAWFHWPGYQPPAGEARCDCHPLV